MKYIKDRSMNKRKDCSPSLISKLAGDPALRCTYLARQADNINIGSDIIELLCILLLPDKSMASGGTHPAGFVFQKSNKGNR